MKSVSLQDSRIFRIYILLNFEILFLEDYRFQNSESLEGLKEYTLNANAPFVAMALISNKTDVNVTFWCLLSNTHFMKFFHPISLQKS